MERSPCCSKDSQRRTWTAEEDFILVQYIKAHSHGEWNYLAKETGLKRSGKSCRLRWLNYLRPDIKRGSFAPDEDDLIIKMHRLLGNRWTLIAKRIPGRTDSEIKNYWNARLSKRAAILHNEITNISSSTSIEDNCTSKCIPIETTALRNPGTLISDGSDSSVLIKEPEDHVDLNFSFNDDLHALIETEYLDEVGHFESLMQLGNSFESNVEKEQSFAVEMLANHDQVELKSSLRSKLQLLRQILELEDE